MMVTLNLHSLPLSRNYLASSDLKSSLAYPNGLTASWAYGNELLEVDNASVAGTISKYVYTYDAAGRRISCAKSGTAFAQSDSVNYGYNTRSELTSATAAVDSDYRYGYNFDDIGNRKTSSERGTNSVYTASQLNQYTAVNDFTPTYDADGNETIVKTATGIWNVFYNGENRPVRWELVSSNSNTPNSNTQTLLRMSFDRMGRRVTKNDQRFVYNGYLQIANFRSTTTTSDYNYFIWDPTEPVATRPLAWQRGTSVAYYTHDGNKNVSEVIDSNNDVAAHYEYAPFGALTVSSGASAADNPWRFSSEYAEDDTATVYYNYRHYEPLTGRWMSRDPIEDEEVLGYVFISNCPIGDWDEFGLLSFMDLLYEAGGRDMSWPIPPGSVGIPIGLGGGRLMIIVSSSGYLFRCCNERGFVETWAHGNLGLEAYVVWGYAGQGWKGKGHDRNKRNPNTGTKNKKSKPQVKGFKERDWHGDWYYTEKKCPQKPWFGGYFTVFVRGTAGFGIGGQVNVQRTWNWGDNADGSDLDISVSAANGVYGVSIEVGAGGGIVGEFRVAP